MIERSISIAAPIECVYEAIRDFKSYPQFLNTTLSAHENANAEVEFKVQVIKSLTYILKFNFDAPTGLSWSLVRGELMKTNTGSWTLSPVGETQTEALYRIDVEFGWMVPKSIVEQLTKTQLPGLLESFRNRAEKIYQTKLGSS